jgi:hypothetical protein
MARSPERLAVTAMEVALLALALLPLVVAAASPEPPVISPGDPRSEGEGPGLVGDPLLVLMGVVLLGALASGITLLVLRLTRED